MAPAASSTTPEPEASATKSPLLELLTSTVTIDGITRAATIAAGEVGVAVPGPSGVVSSESKARSTAEAVTAPMSADSARAPTNAQRRGRGGMARSGGGPEAIVAGSTQGSESGDSGSNPHPV